MAHKIFDNIRALSQPDLETYAGAVGLNVDKWKVDVADPAIAKQVDDDTAAGKAAGVRGTPTILVNGKRFNGQRTLEGFKPVIDEEIGKADKLIQAGTPLDKVYEKLSKGEGG